MMLIYVSPLGNVPEDIIAAVEAALGRSFGARVEHYAAGFDPVIAYDPKRKQYNSTVILEALHREIPHDESKTIGIAGFDLFIPVLTFVFGEAQLGGRVALASYFRLHNRFYGLPEDEELLVERFTKEVIHELGHAFGLVHCSDPGCVMHVSTAVEEVDVKGGDLCGRCRKQLSNDIRA